jgi:gluconokinase
MIIVVMGVSGAGKTTVGKLLAEKLGWTFLDADDFHSPANVAKMRSGIPLTDEDRLPWLEAIRKRLDEALVRKENVVLACSALKHDYQHYLQQHDPRHIHYVFLGASEEVIAKRLAARKGHFMNPRLLHSQFETLEPPEHAIEVDAAGEPESIVAAIRRRLGV